MKIKQVTCTMGKTINTGNYQSDRVDWSETWDLDENEDIDDVWPEITDSCRTGLQRAIKEARLL